MDSELRVTAQCNIVLCLLLTFYQSIVRSGKANLNLDT